MMKHLLVWVLLISGVLTTQAQITYEDFEGGASKITWNALNGLVYEGPIANPAKDAVNSSDFVGKFTNDGISDFCFGLGDFATPADLSQFNLMKIKIWSPVATRALLKFEGGGTAIEKFIDITVTEKWVEYSVDFSAASTTAHTKVLLAFNPFTTPAFSSFYFDDIRGVEAKEVFETFETGNELGWNAFDGTLEAPIDNPAPNSVNSTAKVGKYTKSGAHSYSLLLAEKATPFDLSVLNQLKLQIHASAPTQVLLKLEGAGPAVEKIANIGLTNAWQEYTFDLSSAKDFKHLTKAILFFDPGVETSADVYHFDNFYAVSQGECAGKELDASILDDFECNRNATYVNGWDSLTVIPNPGADAVNGSTKVGKFVDQLGEPWNGLLWEYQNAVNLETKNQFNIKIWSSKATRVLAKLEGGASGASEVWIDIVETNKWVQYIADFSSQALANHKKMILFFNAGNDPAPGDVYYIDDLTWAEKTVTDIENFEAGATLPWEPLDQQTLIHGLFEVVNNPDASGVNASSKVGKYTKGVSPFSTLAAVAPGAIDITDKPQYNLDVWAPVGSTSVTFQLESASSGNKEVTRDVTTPGSWETMSFDFSDFQAVTDWAALKLIFNPGVAEEGKVFYFDNLRQGDSTVDPCEGAVTINNIVDDFECQRNYEYGAGAELIAAVNNPKLTAANSSTKVGLYKDQPNQPWSALCVNFPEGIDLTVFNQLELQVLSTAAVPVLLKLEGGSSPAKEIWTAITIANDWETLSADFSGESGNDHKRVCFFFNGGVETTTVDDYFIDNIKFAHAPYDGCLVNYDNPAFESNVWNYFPADNSGAFEQVDNPLKAGINTSDKVGKATEKASGEQPWQGMYTDLESYIKFGANTVIKAKILSPKITTITLKVEKPLVAGFPGGSGDVTVANTKINEWEELSWDFSAAPTPIDPAGQYARLTWIFDILNLPSEDVVYYFDDIRLESSDCGQSSSVFDTPKLELLSVSPNPVSDVLRIENAASLKSTDIFNVYGQRVAKLWNSNQNLSHIDVSALPAGAYFIMGYNDKNQPTAQARFIKM